MCRRVHIHTAQYYNVYCYVLFVADIIFIMGYRHGPKKKKKNVFCRYVENIDACVLDDN